MNDFRRLRVATLIFQGICAGDWKFDVKEKSWDDMAIDRAFELADKLLDKYYGVQQ